MNEGHAGFLGVERIRELMDAERLDFDTALTVVRSSTVFTTHTPVPAGIDRFPLEMVQRYFGDDGPDGLLPGVPATTAMESALIVYRYAWTLGFRRAHFEVHRDNAPVRRRLYLFKFIYAMTGLFNWRAWRAELAERERQNKLPFSGGNTPVDAA